MGWPPDKWTASGSIDDPHGSIAGHQANRVELDSRWNDLLLERRRHNGIVHTHRHKHSVLYSLVGWRLGRLSVWKWCQSICSISLDSQRNGTLEWISTKWEGAEKHEKWMASQDDPIVPMSQQSNRNSSTLYRVIVPRVHDPHPLLLLFFPPRHCNYETTDLHCVQIKAVLDNRGEKEEKEIDCITTTKKDGIPSLTRIVGASF